MQIHLVAVGRFGRGKSGPERALYEHFAGRISPKPILREVGEKRPLQPRERRRREGASLRRAVPEGAFVVALDEAGRTLSSGAFAERLRILRDDGVRDLAFLVGGTDGLDPAVTRRADLVLSLGPMTWPHLLVRGLLAEQIFRAQCILSGHPYHRE